MIPQALEAYVEILVIGTPDREAFIISPNREKRLYRNHQPAVDTPRQSIRALLDRYIRPSDVIVDPMCRESLIGTYRNDIDPKAPGAITHMDAVAFLDDLLAKGIAADVVLWDPPFSVNQARKYGRKDETPHSFNVLRHECRNRIARLVRPGGLVICLAFHGNGLERPGFETIERLNVTHGGFSYDTIVVVQRRAPHALDQTQPN